MTKAAQANHRAAEKGSGQGGESNAAGTATGPGSSPASRSKKDTQHHMLSQRAPITWKPFPP